MPESKSPGPVPREALDFFRRKDLRPGFHYKDVWGDEHAHAFTVAKAVKLDILQDIKDGLEEALADGKTFRQFAKEITPTLQRKGWWGVQEQIDPLTGERVQAQLGSPRRLKTIYRSNMRSARAAGQWERVQRNKKTQPFLVYLLGPSREHRDEHVRLQGLTLPVDHPIWQEIMPPNGYECKCHVRQITRAEHDRFLEDGVPDATAPQEIDPSTGLPTGRRVARRITAQTEPPPLRRRRFVNERTGETVRVLDGIHPAWANNPGQARVRVLREALTQRLESADQLMARHAVDTVVDSPVLNQYITDVRRQRTLLLTRGDRGGARTRAIEQIGELPIAFVDRAAARLMGAGTQLARISPESMAKQLANHGDVTRGDYRRLSDLLARGEIVEEKPGLFRIFSQDGEGRLWRAVIKTAGRDNRELFLQSYHRARPRDLLQARNAGKVLRKGRE